MFHFSNIMQKRLQLLPVKFQGRQTMAVGSCCIIRQVAAPSSGAWGEVCCWWSLLCTVDTATEQPVRETVVFTVIYSKQKYEVNFALDETVDALKNHIEKLTGTFFV